MPKPEFGASLTAKEKNENVTLGSGVNASLGGVSGANWNSTTVGSSGWSTEKGQTSDLWGLSGNKSQTQHIGLDGLNQSSTQGMNIAGLGGVSAQSSSAIGPDGISMSEHYDFFGQKFGYDARIPAPNVTAGYRDAVDGLRSGASGAGNMFTEESASAFQGLSEFFFRLG